MNSWRWRFHSKIETVDDEKFKYTKEGQMRGIVRYVSIVSSNKDVDARLKFIQWIVIQSQRGEFEIQ